jgi:sulfur carrier protein
MQIQVNGEGQQFEDRTSLAELLAASVQRTDGVAVAVNRVVVPRSRWATHTLAGGDQVEIIQAVGGG